MDNGMFLGMSLETWGYACLMIAFIYAFFWPKPRGTHERSRATRLMLRWGQPFLWVLLAVACFLWAGGEMVLPNVLAYFALAFYVVYLVVMVRDRSRSFSAGNQPTKHR